MAGPPAPRPPGACPHHRPSRGSSAQSPQYILSSLGLSGFGRASLATESPEHTARGQQGTAPPTAGAQRQAERQPPAEPQGRLEEPLQGARKTAHTSETVHPYLLARTFEISRFCRLITCGQFHPFPLEMTSEPSSTEPQGLARVRIKAPRLTGLTWHESPREQRNSHQKVYRYQALERL